MLTGSSKIISAGDPLFIFVLYFISLCTLFTLFTSLWGLSSSHILGLNFPPGFGLLPLELLGVFPGVGVFLPSLLQA